MIVPPLLVLAALSNGGMTEGSAPPPAPETQAALQAEFKRAWLESSSYSSNDNLRSSRAYAERQQPATNVVTHRVVLRYDKPLSNSDSEVVLQIDKDGRVAKVLVDQNSHLGALFEAECKSLQLERPPKSPFYLGFAISTPGVP